MNHPHPSPKPQPRGGRARLDAGELARLKARQEVLRAELAAAGLTTPQAIWAAYEAMDAGEREAIEARLGAPVKAASPPKTAFRHLSRRL